MNRDSRHVEVERLLLDRWRKHELGARLSANCGGLEEAEGVRDVQALEKV